MLNFKITVSYDGTDFSGWQCQQNGRTVQGLLEKALAQVTGQKIVLNGSGRTDAGVHARAQVANFLTEANRNPYQIVCGTNSLLPSDVAIVSAAIMPPNFHARFSCQGKTYTYDFLCSKIRNPLLARHSWLVGPKLDWNLIETAKDFILGEHDFAAFRSAGSETKGSTRYISEIKISHLEDEIIRLSITGSGFLRHMVRSIAGTLWLVGRKKINPIDLVDIIESKDRSQAGPVAPPQGLCLHEVFYDGKLN